jgi:hypothetical protein
MFERITISDDGEIVGELQARFRLSSRPPARPMRAEP